MRPTPRSISAVISGPRTRPEYSSRAHVAASSEVVAIDPAPAAAVTTEVNGTIPVPSERSIGGAVRDVPAKR